MGSGRSYPRSRRSASTCAGVAVSPATSATGSAGMIRETTNVTTSSPSRVGMNHRSRWSASASSLMVLSHHVRAPALPAQSWSGGRQGGARRQARDDRRKGGEAPLRVLLRVREPADLLAVADGAEADALEVLGPGTEVLRVVDPDAGRLVHHDTRGVLVRLLAHLAIGRLQRGVEQLVDLRILVEAGGLERPPLPG